MNFKKILITFAFVFSLFSVSAYAKTMQFTMGDYDAKVDNGEIEVHTMEVAPYTVEGRTMVPVRIIGEAFGADVDYIHEELKVVITLGDKTISLIIGEDTADVNGEIVKLDVPSVETNGRTLAPLRFVSENLDLDVKYIAVTEQILVTNDKPFVEINGSKAFPADIDAVFNMYNTEYAGYYEEADILANAKLMVTDYILFESEANKWDIPYPYSLKEEIISSVAELDAVFPGTLDAVWANLVEIECRAADLNEFLYQIYLPSEEDAKAYEAEELKDHMAAKHILVSDKALATEILGNLKNGADFDTLMNQYSEDPGTQTNPDGYVFTDGEMVAEFEVATKKLKIDEVSGIVESEFGYHIIKRIAIPNAFIVDACAKDLMAKHFNDVVENGDVKSDTYTDEQLLEFCK